MNEIERTLVERAGGLHYCWLHFFAPDFQSLLKVLQRSPKFWNFYLSFFFKLLSTCRYKLNVTAQGSSTALSLLLFPNTETFLPSYKKDKLAISTFKCLLKLHTEMGTHNQILSSFLLGRSCSKVSLCRFPRHGGQFFNTRPLLKQLVKMLLGSKLSRKEFCYLIHRRT